MRFAPILLASLLLHLVIVIAVTDVSRQEDILRRLSQNMVVEYLESGNDIKKQPDMTVPRNVTVPTPKQQPAAPAAREAATAPPLLKNSALRDPVRQNAPLYGAPASSLTVPAEQGGTTAAGNAGASVKGGVSGVISDRHGNTGTGAVLKAGSGMASSASLQRRGAYQALLKRLIEAHKEYPLAARRSGREGSCQRRFVISRTGLLKRVESLSSCGNAFLDEAATRAISAVGTFPPLPDDFKDAEEAFIITMTFTLARQ